MPFFVNLEDFLLTRLEDSVNLITYNKGDIIFREGEIGDALYIIRTGFVKITKKHGDTDQIIAYLSHGNYFGEIALFEDERRSATVSAFTRTEVIEVLKEDFTMLLESDSELYREIKDIVLERKFKTLEVERDPEKARRIEAIVEGGLIEAGSLLIIDLKTCIHCNNCVDACQDRHGYPRLDRRGTRIGSISFPVACRLCPDPLCLVCNFDAIKRAPSGEVHIIDEKCIGVSLNPEESLIKSFSVLAGISSTTVSSFAETVALLGLPERAAISPKIFPSSKRDNVRFSRPSVLMLTSTVPSIIA